MLARAKLEVRRVRRKSTWKWNKTVSKICFSFVEFWIKLLFALFRRARAPVAFQFREIFQFSSSSELELELRNSDDDATARPKAKRQKFHSTSLEFHRLHRRSCLLVTFSILCSLHARQNLTRAARRVNLMKTTRRANLESFK